MASVMPSTSASSLTVEQTPVLVTAVLTHTSWLLLMQRFDVPLQSVSTMQTRAGVALHVPENGQPPVPVSAVQLMSLERLQAPRLLGRAATLAEPTQSPSQASPTRSPSLSSWFVFG